MPPPPVQNRVKQERTKIFLKPDRYETKVFSTSTCNSYRHRRQTCLPRWQKELAARIKGDVLSRLDGALYSLKVLIMKSRSIFMSPFDARQLTLSCTPRSHVILQGKFLKTPGVDYIAISLLKQTDCNKSSSKSGLLRVHILGKCHFLPGGGCS